MMRMIFIRHGAKRSNGGELTSIGRKMSFETGKWLTEKGYFPQLAFHSATTRTQQTLTEILLACEKTLPTKEIEIPDFWEDWLTMLEKISQTNTSDFIIVGHHPTTEMLANYYNISIPTQNFATAIVLQKSSNRLWNYIDSWQGRAAIS